MKIVTVNDRNIKFAQEVVKLLHQQNIRVELDDRTESIGKKVRDAQVDKANYIVTIGDKETDKKVLAVRDRGGSVKFDISVQKFVTDVVEEMKEENYNNYFLFEVKVFYLIFCETKIIGHNIWIGVFRS